MVESVRVQIEILPGNQDLPLPRYMTEHAAGMDICAAVSDVLVLPPGDRAMVPGGFAISIPEGYEAEIRPRSGLAFKSGLTLINSPGTIDSDYRGEVMVLMVNLGKDSFTIRRGDRIAQMLLHPVCRVEWEVCDTLGKTKRGAGGFGHTG